MRKTIFSWPQRTIENFRELVQKMHLRNRAKTS
jgi:hypothetical protein